MGTKERKVREKELRRNHIIDAAETIIFDKGLDHSTMKEIAEEAELSKGTLYLYFKNKTDLYMAICERGSNILTERFNKVFASNHTGLELIRLMGETYLEFVRDNPDYFNTFKGYETQNPEKLKNNERARVCEQNAQESMNLMVHALQIGMQDGTVDDSYDPKELAMIIWACSNGLTTMYHLERSGHFSKMLEEMEMKSESLFENFLNLLGCGMATEKGKEKI